METAKKSGEEKPKADEVITVKLVPQDGGVSFFHSIAENQIGTKGKL